MNQHLETIREFLQQNSSPGQRDDEEILKVLDKIEKQLEQEKRTAAIQKRELEIEAALDKIRARALAMHSSDELVEVANVLREQMGLLGQPALESCIVHLYNGEEESFSSWYAFSTTANKIVTGFAKVSKHASQWAREVMANYQSSKTEYTIISGGSKIAEWYKVLEKVAPETIEYDDKGEIIVPPVLYYHFSKFSGGALLMISNENPSREACELKQRAAVVFEFAYTRFLDLQKAEAQARESQIQLALERVRARTMAMQKSDELSDVATVLFQQVKALGVPQWACGFCIWDIGDTGCMWYPGSPDGEILTPAWFPLTEHPVFKIMDESRKRGDELYILEKEGEVQADHYRYMMTLPGVRQLLQSLLDAGLTFPAFQIDHYANFSYGNLIFITYEHFPEMHDIFKRFAKVFEQTYTRFLDLQKAEAQAREAKIEVALEKVRAKAMAMQNSDELSDLVAILFEELTKLELTLARCIIWIFDSPSLSARVWMANSEDKKPAKSYFISRLDHPYYKAILKGWQSKNPKWKYDLRGKEKKSIDQLLLNETELSRLPDSVKNGILHAEHTVVSGSFNNFGLIEASGPAELSDDQMEILTRFAKVFDLTYTRFNDLKQAEMQAREAKIEAALERVRGKAMAMHNSQDLAATIGAFYRELETFSITPRRCGVGLLNKGTRIAELSTMNTTGQGDMIEIIGSLKMQGHPVLDGVYDNWVLQKEYHPVLRGNEIKEYYQLLRPQISFPDYPNDVVQYGYFFFFKEGGVYAWTEKEMNESELQIYRRFTTVLSLTYKRYMDLKQAEANATEAVKQAALDRIRAEIASMRNVDDLEKITPLIWNELTILHIPFIRCGVFIMDESQRLIHTFLSTPEGKAIASFHIPYDTPGNIHKVLSHWHEKSTYIDHWNETAFVEFANTLVKQGVMKSPDQYLKTLPRIGFYLHFLPFLQGMLYVGNATQLNEQQITLIQSVGDAFSTAYARYEDFTKLEAAKQQVEKALTDLKQAQTQLVQSEKMASLGELTAGIAHEIQNPLNFVNNFSDVSNELLEEMKEELVKGNIADAVIIAENVKQNLDKITHHGKRADGIVKGMLQHSRASSGQKELTDINVLADEYIRLAYHGLRAKDKSFNAKFETRFDESISKIKIVPQDIGRVLLNLINNAFYAASLPLPTGQAGSKGGFLDPDSNKVPTVWVSTKKENNKILISVRDNGPGIAANILDKIFQPFFTTKPTGQGTGLGLSLSYDIIKAHGGQFDVNTKEGEGTEFVIQLPAV